MDSLSDRRPRGIAGPAKRRNGETSSDGKLLCEKQSFELKRKRTENGGSSREKIGGVRERDVSGSKRRRDKNETSDDDKLVLSQILRKEQSAVDVDRSKSKSGKLMSKIAVKNHSAAEVKHLVKFAKSAVDVDRSEGKSGKAMSKITMKNCWAGAVKLLDKKKKGVYDEKVETESSFKGAVGYGVKRNSHHRGNRDLHSHLTRVSLQSQAVKTRLKKNESEKDKNDKNKEHRSFMCHQCQRSDKNGIVFCSECNRKRYCYDCITKWYPQKTREEIQNACPHCCGNCNCKACLRQFLDVKPCDNIDNSFKLQQLQYMLYKALPVLRHVYRELSFELGFEAKKRGVQVVEKDIQRIKLDKEERVYWSKQS